MGMIRTDSKTKNTAVVLSCMGGDQGDLGMVRSLGRMGVPITFVTENVRAHALHSKYVKEVIQVDSFCDNQKATLETLIDYASSLELKPVLFPTADPDLEFVSQHEANLKEYYFLTIPSRLIVKTCLDKKRFFEYGTTHGLPLPQTLAESENIGIEDIANSVSYPVILKPMNPKTWTKREIAHIVKSKKAVLLETKDALLNIYREISRYDTEMVVQSYIPGRDDRLISVHVYMGKNGEALAAFSGRKIRTYPAYAGIGCFVVSEYIEELIGTTINILKKFGYFGLALLQFKQDEKTGEFRLLEINARTSSWNQLPLACNINLPWLAWLDAVGKEMPACESQKDGVVYLYFRPDLSAMREYVKTGDWSWKKWLLSLLKVRVCQLYCRDDIKPFIMVLYRDAKLFISKKLFRRS